MDGSGVISSEDDVRAFVRQASEGKARWVEPGLGSTNGLPDCWVPFEGKQVHLELKVGRIQGGKLCFRMRPEQRREIRAMLEDGVPVGLAVGLLGTKSIIFLPPKMDVLNGKVDFAGNRTETKRLEVTTENQILFWKGVRFIFLISG